MARRRSGSSAQCRRHAKSGKLIPDSQIDFSDIPESSGTELARAGRVGRPPTGHAKQLIAIRIAPSLLAKLKGLAKKQHKPYQTLLHELLEEAVRRKAA